MEMYAIAFIAIIISSVLTSVIRNLLGVKIYSDTKHGELVYFVIYDTVKGIGYYIIISAFAGHWLQ